MFFYKHKHIGRFARIPHLKGSNQIKTKNSLWSHKLSLWPQCEIFYIYIRFLITFIKLSTWWNLEADLAKSLEKLIRTCHPEVFCEKGGLRNSKKFTAKHLCQSHFLNKVAGLRQLRLIFLLANIWGLDRGNNPKFVIDVISKSLLKVKNMWTNLLLLLSYFHRSNKGDSNFVLSIMYNWASPMSSPR